MLLMIYVLLLRSLPKPSLRFSLPIENIRSFIERRLWIAVSMKMHLQWRFESFAFQIHFSQLEFLGDRFLYRDDRRTKCIVYKHRDTYSLRSLENSNEFYFVWCFILRETYKSNTGNVSFVIRQLEIKGGEKHWICLKYQQVRWYLRLRLTVYVQMISILSDEFVRHLKNHSCYFCARVTCS